MRVQKTVFYLTNPTRRDRDRALRFAEGHLNEIAERAMRKAGRNPKPSDILLHAVALAYLDGCEQGMLDALHFHVQPCSHVKRVKEKSQFQ